jgi:hypothetical protein
MIYFNNPALQMLQDCVMRANFPSNETPTERKARKDKERKEWEEHLWSTL